MKSGQIVRQLVVGISAFCFISTALAAYPLWTFSPNRNYPPNISVKSTQTATVVYTVQNQSHKAKSLVIKPFPGLTQTQSCQLKPVGQPGSSCPLILAIDGNALPSEGLHTGPILCEANANGTPNANQCYRPSPPDNLTINVAQPTVGVRITVDPFIFLIAEGGAQVVTVTNEASSSAAAQQVTATIPSGSPITQSATTCSSSLPIGASCTITFTSSTQTGPTIIPVKGDNTNTANIYAAVTDQPIISISGPIQQSRVIPTSPGSLTLQITNDPNNIIDAIDITVTDKTSCPNLVVDDTACTVVTPGGTCNLVLSSLTPYAPCTITIAGTNTANSPTTLIAFSHLGGLVFQSNGVTGKVVIDHSNEFTSEWTFPSKAEVPGASSDDDGTGNTNAITADPACTNRSTNCAAARCRLNGPEWYLPAKNELQAVIFALCPGSSFPCSFGNFSSAFYWSSTQWFAATNAYSVDVPDGNFGPTDKWDSKPVRCIRSY